MDDNMNNNTEEIENVSANEVITEETVTEEVVTEEVVAEETVTEEDVTEEDVTEEAVTEETETEETATEEAETKKSVTEEKSENIQEKVVEQRKEPAKEQPKRKKVKGFGVCKFTLSFMMMLFTIIAGGTLMIDMFIMNYEKSVVNEYSYVEYIKGTDIFNMINYFGDFSGNEKTFVITSIVCMIVTIGIGIVQLFLIMLWRNKRGYIVVMFTSVVAIVSEGIMICVFLEKYVHSQFDAIGMVAYGPIIAIASHVFIIMLAGITRKLTKINSVVNP